MLARAVVNVWGCSHFPHRCIEPWGGVEKQWRDVMMGFTWRITNVIGNGKPRWNFLTNWSWTNCGHCWRKLAHLLALQALPLSSPNTLTQGQAELSLDLWGEFSGGSLSVSQWGISAHVKMKCSGSIAKLLYSWECNVERLDIWAYMTNMLFLCSGEILVSQCSQITESI